jgi:hypothetical protein
LLSHEERSHILSNQKAELVTNIRLTPYLWHFLYIEEAYGSFHNQFFVSSILNASALVESLLYWEYIRKNPKYQQAGQTLPENVTLGTLFRELEPICKALTVLRDRDETNSNSRDLRFIKIRNKFAHGDLTTFIPFPSEYLPRSDELDKYGISLEEYINPPQNKRNFENVAYYQLTKSFNFVEKFIQYIKESYPSS